MNAVLNPSAKLSYMSSTMSHFKLEHILLSHRQREESAARLSLARAARDLADVLRCKRLRTTLADVDTEVVTALKRIDGDVVAGHPGLAVVFVSRCCCITSCT
jgi:hypothetical protein